MKKFIRPRKDQKGFTLVELVVVLGIMAALAAVVVPVVARFAGRGDTEANDTEVQTVQAAFDLYISNANTAFAANGSATSDFSASSTLALYPSYMRQDTTKCTYTWTAYDPTTAQDGGVVTQVNCP